MLHPQLAWYIGGPVLGLCVVAMLATATFFGTAIAVSFLIEALI